MQDINPRMGDPMKIDERRVADAGIRSIEGRYVTIYTDAPESDAVEELPVIFDAAVPQWCEYFGVDVAETEPWKMKAFLIRDKSRFETAGLIPADLPKFPAGINRGHELWFFVQPDDYYTRHLLLHEGTHAFMQWFGSGLGAPWYAEGMAELLGLHRWTDGKLTIHHRVKDPGESEGWGRPKLIKQWVAANREGQQDKSLQDVLLTPNRAYGDVENYAWSWAACEFLSEHPLSKDLFPELQKHVQRSPDSFNRKFESLFGEVLALLERDWAWFIRELDYGYSVSRGAMSELRIGDEDNLFELQSDRSWQFLNRQIKAGQKFRITATGRFEIGSSTVDGKRKPWQSEASGITIDYYRGRPIGEVQAMMLPLQSNTGLLPKICEANPVSLGAGSVFTADVDGLLCFRINESPANLGDNRGELKLAIEKVE
ncbi:hypothetical protein [Mariniblastus fucicola]|nr:hypothetical protein [Mariniblastus fucicola]